MACKYLLYVYAVNCYKTHSSSNLYVLSLKFIQKYGLIMVVPEILDFIYYFRLEKPMFQRLGKGRTYCH